MHELSVCHSMLDQVERIAAQRGASGVYAVRVRIGPLSGVDPSLLAEAFPVASTGTVADGARLDIEPAPLRVRCARCGGESEVAPNRLICPECGDWRTRLLSGDELLLASLELEIEPGTASKR
ncbi:MAG: hydrogenase maturation nickel metallochaperone HypA [Gammaproteobacteria bacterium]|nr:hydrogenase maturation nickel metallochaperone HypA [Gammaproteobacteria bacterium]NIR96778.1 hydrogenase maturation nickel metallochaperone HypA [Gammaproteobacteria bacterium]NIT62483.1 hydrogenase maturation nickel metallochaperone HypA [Gammaproteobacteria bacterium]NIV19418.1 hydrogenase maturation nickel metallochaperone HypA [Gammaproteobacteria bacterium]NIX10506.1 hydrogenase maturation nickel metallochaperone HypA [Gammaproteobacteria bacterium]